MSQKRNFDDNDNNGGAIDVHYHCLFPSDAHEKRSSSTDGNSKTKSARASSRQYDQISRPAIPAVRLVTAIIPALETLLHQLLVTICELSDEDVARFSAKDGAAPQKWRDTQKLVTVFRQMCGLPATGAMTHEMKASMEVTLSDPVLCRLGYLDTVFQIIDHEPQPEVVKEAMQTYRLHAKGLLNGTSGNQYWPAEAEDGTVLGVQTSPDREGDEINNDEPVNQDESEERQRSVSIRSKDRESSTQQEVPLNTPQPSHHASPKSIDEASKDQRAAPTNPFEQDDAIAQFALETHIQLSQPGYANMFAYQGQPNPQSPQVRSNPAAQPTRPSSAHPPRSTANIVHPANPPLTPGPSTLDLYRFALAKSTNSKSAPAPRPNPKHRAPWTDTEVHALMTGLDRVQGPYWSAILSMYGPTGTISHALAARNQVQLKDKARNLKMLFLKQGLEVPRYLRDVTGDLRSRAPKREGREGQRHGEVLRHEGLGSVRARGDAIAALALGASGVDAVLERGTGVAKNGVDLGDDGGGGFYGDDDAMDHDAS